MSDPPSRTPARWFVLSCRNAILLQEHAERASSTIRISRVDALLAAGELQRVRPPPDTGAFLQPFRHGPPRCDQAHPSRTRGSLAAIREPIPKGAPVTVHSHHLHLGPRRGRTISTSLPHLVSERRRRRRLPSCTAW